MHAWEMMMSLSIGILGGVVSGVIVSRIFGIVNDMNDQLRWFEESMNRLLNIHGMLMGIKAVMEFTYDSEIKKEMEIKQKGYKDEHEYYNVHKDTRWIDADVLLINLLKECQKWSDTLKNRINDTTATNEQKIRHLYQLICKIINDISQLKNTTFESIQKVDAAIANVEKEYEDYKKQLGKMYLKNIFKDKIVIVLILVVVSLIAITIVLFVNNI